MIAILSAIDADVAAFLAVLLIASAAHKLLARNRLIVSARGLGGWNDRQAVLALAAATAAEATAGPALAFPQAQTLGAVVAATLWCCYTLLMLRAIVAGRSNVDCGCSFGRGHASAGNAGLLRNSALIATAVVVGSKAAITGPVPVGPSELLIGVGLFTFYAAFDQIGALSPRKHPAL